MNSILAGAAALMLAAVAGCSVPAAAPAPLPAGGGASVVLRFGHHAVRATLTGSPAARQLAGMLPVTVQLKDVWGQAKSGRLPQPLTVQDAVAVHDPAPGHIYFWPLTEVIAVYYDDLGQRVPAPGLVALGTIDDGLTEITAIGRGAAVRIE
ncbi:cyclophilin-like fold protein [Paractinoplanes atraurantiacus]|uniref:Cyclophilin-like domain-containing protein n=1 Tax=Paractinoplanes atraurantiacus TaxID=1036182 RepID=A0A285J4E3_9ACTN|nr:cyclophilin-like fold protein [Actinoplanes atraurantiacus]SNY55082.1 hypothetical protein SAMN05421748_11630 [Actinoplanes atraurantiacus]